MCPQLFTFRLPAHTTPFRIGFLRFIFQIIYKEYEYKHLSLDRKQIVNSNDQIFKT